MPAHSNELHRRVRFLITRAEQNEDLHAALKEKPAATLAVFGIGAAEIEGFGSDDDDPPDPGCADGTCWSSHCPETCYVTICSPSAFLRDPDDMVINPQKDLGHDALQGRQGPHG